MHRRDLLGWIIATPLAAAAGAAKAQSREIPVETLFRRAAISGASLSPDRRRMAVLMPANGRANLAIYDFDRKAATRLTNLSGSDVSRVVWANNGRLLFTTGDQQGKEFRGDGGLFAVDADGANPVTLVKPFLTGNAVSMVPRMTEVLRRMKDSSDEVLVVANDRSIDSADVYRMDVRTGRKSLVSVSSPGNVVSWVLDADNVPRAAYCMDMEKCRWWFAYQPDPASRNWKVMAEWDEGMKDVIIPLAFDPTAPGILFVASNVGRETVALFEFDTASGKLGELIYADDRHDVFSFLMLGAPLGDGGRLIFGGTEEKPAALIGLAYQADKPRYIWFDKAAASSHAALSAAFKDQAIGFDPAAAVTLVAARSDRNPGEYWLYDRAKGSLTDTGLRARPWIQPSAMRPMQPVNWTARDGVRVDGYLTLPEAWSKGKPVPLILHPHGGPWARDNWGFNPEVQFMANRGFAVLQPNFRGSTGYGARHLRLSYKTWGSTMIDDMIDGVEWAVREGYAQRERVAVYGASYGGYATLMAMVRRPDLFKWGVNYVGVTDMKVHQDTQPAQLHGNFSTLARRINGDQSADKSLFDDQSPARHVDRIAAPVFHAYGGEDRNVDFANGRTIRSAFERANKPFEWMFVADEAHGYRQNENVVAFYTRFDAFMKKHTP